MNAKPRTIIVLIGIFVAGVATGVMLPWRAFPPRGMGPMGGGPRPMMLRMLERMEQDLALTADQRKQVEVVLRESTANLDRLRKESFQNGAAAILDMNAKIEALLTPAQREKFLQMQRDQLERMRQHQAERDTFGPRREGLPPDGMLPPPGGFPEGRPPRDLPPGEGPPPPRE